MTEPPDSFDDDFGERFDLQEELARYDEAQQDRRWAYEEQQIQWYRIHRKPVYPEPVKYPEFRKKVKRELPIDLLKEYQNQGLRVIVKIASIHLTPEHPKYEVGSWHVEGRCSPTH